MDRKPKERKGRPARRRAGENKKRTRPEALMPDLPPSRDYDPCPFCGQKITDINSAVAHPETKQPCHFDCVLAEITAQEPLSANEVLCYLGRGSFGIVVDRKNAAGTPRYSVRKRIQFEEAERPIDWRRELSPGISKG